MGRRESVRAVVVVRIHQEAARRAGAPRGLPPVGRPDLCDRRAARERGEDPGLRLAIARCLDGDDSGLGYVYARCAPRVHAYLLTVLRDEHEAEDVTQQVFLRLMSKLHLYRPEQAPFHSWLLRLAHNVAVDHLRHRRPAPSERALDEHEPAGGEGDDRGRELREALAELAPDHRSVMVMRHVLGMSPAEISRRLGRTEPSVHGLHNRARAALQDRLRARGACPSVTAA